MTGVTQVAYAAPAFAMALLAMPLFIFVPRFYTDEVGVSVGVVGGLLLFGRIVDAVTDPAIGWLSDRTRTRWGRRRPWLAIAAVPLVVSAGLLYVPPSLSRTGSTVWFAVCFLAMAVLSTAVLVPYRALGPELTADFEERTRLFGLREGALVVGTGLAMVLPPLLGFATYTAVAAPIALIAIAGCVFMVREPPPRPIKSSFSGGARDALRNPNFRVLLIGFTVTVFGSNSVAAVASYYVAYVLGSDRLPLFFAVFFLAGIGSLPIWLRLSNRIGRKKAWLWAYAVNTLPFVPVALLGRGDDLIFGVCFALAGLGGVPVIALFPAMQADVIGAIAPRQWTSCSDALDCADDEICAGTACERAWARDYTLYLDSLEVDAAGPNGAWDRFVLPPYVPPDPYVDWCFVWAETEIDPLLSIYVWEPVSACSTTSVVADSYLPVWSEEWDVFALKSVSSAAFSAYDSDFGEDEFIDIVGSTAPIPLEWLQSPYLALPGSYSTLNIGFEAQ